MTDSKDLMRIVKEISEEGAVKMEKEKITPDLVHLMTDDELSNYLPVHGDRLRLRRNLRKEPDEKKNKLLQILHKKLENAKTARKKKDYASSDEEGDMRRQYDNKNAVKGTRSLELGWIHKTHLRSKQVRSRTGGGTRKVCMRKNSTKEEILQEAISLFFPNGENQKGKISDFKIDLWDFSEREVRDSVTLQQMYEETKMPILRFYLAASTKNEDLGYPLKQHQPSQEKDVVARAMELSEIISVGDDELPDIVMNVEPDKQPSSVLSANETEPVNDKNDLEILHLDTHALPTLYSGTEFPDLRDISENDFSEELVVKEMKIRVHRGQVLKDMITAFKGLDVQNLILSFEMVMPNGNVEIAEDGGGVTRDTLSEFWNTFYDQCTLGTEAKVPCLRHDFGESEWAAIGKILLFGWQAQKYLPVNLARPFIEQCFYGKTSSSLQDAFYLYIPPSEATTLKFAINNFEETDFDDLLDVMVLHDSRKVPTKDTLPQLIEEMAHKEIIQAPMFVCDCFQPIVKNMIGESELEEAYKKLTPTGKGVTRIFLFPENMTADEIITANHLKRFVKELTADKLKRFLRFCTGADIIAVEQITVNFVNVTGFARRPVAHTCSSMLELSKAFDSFPQFRSEFNSVLESNYWEMDFI